MPTSKSYDRALRDCVGTAERHSRPANERILGRLQISTDTAASCVCRRTLPFLL